MKGFDVTNNSDEDDDGHGPAIVKSKKGIYIFEPEPPHILSSSLKNNPMSGIRFVPFIQLLFRKRRSIDWYRYKHRLCALFFMGIFNSFLSIIEHFYIFYLLHFKSKSIRDTIRRIQTESAAETESGTETENRFGTAPVFVLGHPRTGTTLLHSLLALDDERFSICDTFMVGFPHCFLWFEKVGKFLFRDILSETRPMDNMKLHFDLPQEDELGTNLLTGCTVSPYNSLMFMRDEREYRKYQCFLDDHDHDHDHDNDLCNKDDVQKWVQAFQSFLRKVKIRDVLRNRRNRNRESALESVPALAPRRLVLKSPCHTGRVRLLLKMFPNAKFIFIHRNPYELFLSGAHLASTTYGWMFLQKPTDEDLQEYILKQGEILHNEYFSCRYGDGDGDGNGNGVLNAQNSVEISFEDLTSNPEESLRKIYAQLGFDSFTAGSNSPYPERLKTECEDLKGYRRNTFKKVVLDETLRETIKERWRNQFDILGYSNVYPSLS